MSEKLHHRGPDDNGHVVMEQVALASRRLSILDLSPNGHMPMSSADGRYTIVYNGEIYNHRELRPELEARGVTFRSQSDTETVLYLYIEHGPAMLERLNGMFVIAIWDNVERELFLARDRLGIKPLVYASQSDRLVFASEEKALIAAGVEPTFDSDCWDELIYFRYISGENTVFRTIKNLLPGHYMLWKSGYARITRYWHLKARVEALRGTIGNPVEWYRETFESAVKYRLLSDVPVGVLLSGGLDSSTIATTTSRLSPNMSSFTVGFENSEFDETRLATEVAAHNKLTSHTCYVSPRTDLPDLVSEASRLLDAPLAHGSDAHVLAVSQLAKKYVTVLLSGEGGDETLGGYVRYRPLQVPALGLHAMGGILRAYEMLPQRLSGRLGIRLKKLRRFIRQGISDDLVLFNSCDVLPIDFADLGVKAGIPDLPFRRKVLAEAKLLYPMEPIRQAMYLDQHTFLQSLLSRNDRMTMGASIECRVPFLDHRLVEGLASLDSKRLLSRRHTKHLLRRSFGSQLPSSIQSSRKIGFGVPWYHYMRDPDTFGPILNRVVASAEAYGNNLSSTKVASLVQSFRAGDSRFIVLLRQLLFFEIWRQECNVRLQ